MRRGVSLTDYLKRNKHEAEDIYPYLVSFVKNCHDASYFHCEMKASDILIEKMEYEVSDVRVKEKSVIRSKYFFRFAVSM